MRIYCDSNVFRKAKPSSNQFSEPVYQAMEKLKGYYIFLFSEAHLHDLAKSAEPYRSEDLDQMERYVNNNYISRDHNQKEFKYYLATPKEAFKSIDFEAFDLVLEDPHAYLTNLFNSEETVPFAGLIKQLFDSPLFDITAIQFPEARPELQEYIDRFKGARSINDVLKKLTGTRELMV